MTKDFKEIKVPNPEKGLSEKQRDRLNVDMANVINYLGTSMKAINGKVNRHDKEIYGDEDSEGMKSKVYGNSRLINIITKILITAGILGGTGFGIIQTVGGF